MAGGYSMKFNIYHKINADNNKYSYVITTGNKSEIWREKYV